MKIMGIKESDAFVLTTYPLAEADKIVVMFTADFGKIRGVARGARRPKNPFGASLEPLSEIHVSFYEKETRELVSIRRSELLFSPFELARTYEGELFLHHLAELTDRFHPLAEPNQKVYRLLKAVLSASRAGRDLWLLTTYFDVWMLRASGFLGDWERCHRCHRACRTTETIWISPDGISYCSSCPRVPDSREITPRARSAWQEIFRLDPLRWSARNHDPSLIRGIWQIAQRLVARVLEQHLKTAIILEARNSSERTRRRR